MPLIPTRMRSPHLVCVVCGTTQSIARRRAVAGPMAIAPGAVGQPVPISDEEELSAVSLLDEVGGADDPLDLAVEVVEPQVLHVGRHPARPEMTAGVDD